jgi:GT2 family glycosyltransferase
MMIVWLAISSYRNDQAVMRILEQAHGSERGNVERVVVVDSEGTGAIPRLIEERGWNDVTYQNYGYNLGSGANLRERLRIAAEGGADYVYALNHDGDFVAETLGKLLEAAESIPNLGAVYPLGYMQRVGRYNLTGTREWPLPAKLTLKAPSEALIEAHWSSSNGALYSTRPAQEGVLPWGMMWMGWEDLEYGWRLSDHGYRQLIVRDAVFRDRYEYRKGRFGPAVDKPAWRTCFFARNLMLAIRRTRNRPTYYAVAAYRFAREAAVILLARREKRARLAALWRGIADGVETRIDREEETERSETANTPATLRRTGRSGGST